MLCSNFYVPHSAISPIFIENEENAMNNSNMPHSRQKTVGTGSANVSKGRQVNTGARPTGGTNRTSSFVRRSAPNGTPGGNQPQRQPGGKLNLKTILIIAAVVIVGFILLRKVGCSGGEYDPTYDPSYTDPYYTSQTTAATSGTPGNPDIGVAEEARDKYVQLANDGTDRVTIMVYMCGTDLESKNGMATRDLVEMQNATLSDKVNLIVLTGGCKKWKNSTISADCNQIYKVETGGMRLIESDFGNAAMTDPANLTKFIRYCNTNFPANRNELIFWDHGGGSISGFGYDEKNPSASSMTLTKINTALENAGCKFDFIGFDACLMATLETSLVCNNHADYLIASEETEPGTGWYYTNWLSELSANPAKPTVQVAARIIDDFVSASCAASSSAKATLSVVDLAELQGTVPKAFTDFAASTGALVSSDSYQQVSDARAGARQFSKNINQIDLVDFAQRLGTAEAQKLCSALLGCVKYNKSSISRCNGISIYFPYETNKTVKTAVASNQAISTENEYNLCMVEYNKCIQSFASLELGGQVAASATQQPASAGSADLLGSLLGSFVGGSASTSPVDSLLGSFLGSGGTPSAGFGLDASSLIGLLGGFSGRSMPAEYDWVDTELIAGHASDIAANFVDPSRITATQKNGRSVLSLTAAEWNSIQTVELNVFVNDGKGFIDLGLDNTFTMDGTDLLLDYDGTWLSLNGNICAYYLVSDTQEADGSWVTVGRIPAILNGQMVYLQVVFTESASGASDVEITGAYPMYETGVTDVQAKGDIPVVAGDTIELLCDYYGLDGTYSASYTLGTSFVVPADGLTIENIRVENTDLEVSYRLTDIYGNNFWLPIK